MAWDDLLGQAFAKRLLQSHLATGRVANGYLFAGPDGVGKRWLALEMAKALNCSGRAGTAVDERPCGRCVACRQIDRAIHPDVHRLGPEGASNQIRIDSIRHLLGRMALRPFHAAFQVAIIEAAERLTEEAANSLLKALEEPSAHARFLLTTSRLSDCLPTIVSRCQLIRCQPLPRQAIIRVLTETRGCPLHVAQTIASLSGGSASAALALAGRWQAQEELAASLAGGHLSDWMARQLPETRQEVTEWLEGMMRWLRDVAMTATGGDAWIAHVGRQEALRQQAATVDLDTCLETALELQQLLDSVEQFVSPRLIAALAREKWLSLTERVT